MNIQLKYYKEFIDALVELVKHNPTAHWVRKGKWAHIPDKDRFEPFLSSLTDDQRALVAEIAQDAREGGIFDVIEYLHVEIDLRGLRISRDGVELAVEPYGTELFWDWIARRDGSQWPEHQLDPKYKADDHPDA
jgi:hypothetical protein